MKEAQRAKDAPRRAHRSAAKEGSIPKGCEVGPEWWTVYRMESQQNPGKCYTGVTRYPHRRLCQHNRKENPSTARYAPYRYVFLASFPDKMIALEFEAYLKTGSGNAFGKKRLWPVFT